jgi:hypothetical protein
LLERKLGRKTARRTLALGIELRTAAALLTLRSAAREREEQE